MCTVLLYFVGVDASGLRKDIFSKFFDQITAPTNKLFESISNERTGSTHYFPLDSKKKSDDDDDDDDSKKNGNSKKYEQIGQILFCCLVNDLPISVEFPSWLYRVITDTCPEKWKVEEWISLSKEIFPQFTNSLLWCRTCDEDLGEMLGDDVEFPVPFISGSEQLQSVNVNNVDYYILHKIKEKFEGGGGERMRLKNANAVKSGFFKHCSKDVLAYLNNLNGTELQLLLSGPEYLDGHVLLSRMQFIGFSSSSAGRSVKGYLETMLKEELNMTQLKLFLISITSLPSLPRCSEDNGKYITIAQVSNHPGRIYAHTCFNRLDVSDSFTSIDEFRRALNTFIENATTSVMDEIN